MKFQLKTGLEVVKIDPKYDSKVTKMGVWGGSGTERGPESFQNTKTLKV